MHRATSSLALVVDTANESVRKAPPDLPRPLADLAPSVIVGTAAWALAGLVLLVLWLLGRDVGMWLATSAAGVACGGFGLAVVAWQRSASRRGSKGAQRGL